MRLRRAAMLVAVLHWTTDAPAQDGVAATGGESEDVAAVLQKQDELIRRMDDSLVPTWMEPWRRKRREWNEKHGLELSYWYGALYQAGIGGDALSAGAGEIAVAGSWAIWGDQTLPRISDDFERFRERNPLSLKFRLRQRHAYGDRSPSELGVDLGAAWGVTDAFNDNGFEIPDLYIRQIIERWNTELRYGQLSVEDQLDGHSLRGVKRSFLNRAFSTNPAVAFPRFGAGATIKWKGDNGWDLTAAVTQVQASKTGDQVDFELTSDDLFYGVQAGYSFEGWGGDPARVQALYWYSDPVKDIGLSSGNGFSLVAEQEFSAQRVRSFARFAHAEDVATDVSNLLAVGVGKERGEFDLMGVGLGLGESSTTGDWQLVIEAFYRWQFAPELHITPDLQILVGEGFEGSGSVRLVPGIRGRLAF
jgi:hypothetical protein